MSVMAFQITSVSIVCSNVCSGADHRKHQSSASLAFARGTHRSPVVSPHKGPVTRKMFPFNDVIMRMFLWFWFNTVNISWSLLNTLWFSGDIDLGQSTLARVVACRLTTPAKPLPQPVSTYNFDLSSYVSSGIHLRAISEVSMNLIL